nr:YdcF family protein [Pelovirga terrestris]
MVAVRPGLLGALVVVDVPLDSADVIVVMAGERRLRLPAVAQLYHQGLSERIYLANDGMFSSWSSKHQRNLYEVEWAREFLLEQGVADDAIAMLDYTASGSYFDALHAAQAIRADNAISTVLVVTSDYHTRRTLWCFNRVLDGSDIRIGVYPVPVNPDSEQYLLKTYATELVKLGYYWLRY